MGLVIVPDHTQPGLSPRVFGALGGENLERSHGRWPGPECVVMRCWASPSTSYFATSAVGKLALFVIAGSRPEPRGSVERGLTCSPGVDSVNEVIPSAPGGTGHVDLVESNASPLDQDLAAVTERDGHIGDEAAGALDDQRAGKMGMLSREDLLERDVEGRRCTAVQINLEVLILAAEQPRLLSRSVGEPDSLDNAGAGGLGQDRVAAFLAGIRE